MTRLEKAAYARLTTNESEKNIVAQDRKLYLTGQMLEFAMTSDQWEEYKTVRGDQFVIGSNDEKLRTSDLGLRTSLLKPFEDFYRIAEARSDAMVDNLLRQCVVLGAQSGLKANKRTSHTKDYGLRTAVLVAGGFHTEGLTRLLKEKGINYVVAAPKVTKVDVAEETR